jgi:hypothetical protein
MVTPEHNNMLNADFTEQVIRDVVFGSYAEGAHGPDGFPFLFYQHFWDLIKNDLLAMVNDWNKGSWIYFGLTFRF